MPSTLTLSHVVRDDMRLVFSAAVICGSLQGTWTPDLLPQTIKVQLFFVKSLHSYLMKIIMSCDNVCSEYQGASPVSLLIKGGGLIRKRSSVSAVVRQNQIRCHKIVLVSMK